MEDSKHIKPEYYTFFRNYPLLYRHGEGDEAAIRNIAVSIKLDEKRYGHDIIKRATKKIKSFKKLEKRLKDNRIFPHQTEQLINIVNTASRIKKNILDHYSVIRGRGRDDFEKSHVQREEDELVLLLAEGAYISHALTSPLKKHYEEKKEKHKKRLRSGEYL